MNIPKHVLNCPWVGQQHDILSFCEHLILILRLSSILSQNDNSVGTSLIPILRQYFITMGYVISTRPFATLLDDDDFDDNDNLGNISSTSLLWHCRSIMAKKKHSSSRLKTRLKCQLVFRLAQSHLNFKSLHRWSRPSLCKCLCVNLILYFTL